MSRTAPVRWLLAVASIAAAAVHFAVGPEHFAEYAPFGLAFTALAWFQALTAAYLVATTRIRFAEALAIVVNLGTIAVWAVSRAVGLPVGPELWTPEQIGTADLVALGLEVGLVAGLAALLRRPDASLRLDGPAPRLLIILAGLGAIAASAWAIWSLAPASMGM